MCRLTRNLGVMSLFVLAVSSVRAQNDTPPSVRIVKWRVSRGVAFFSSCPFNPLNCPTAPFPGPPPFDLGEYVVYDANDPSTSFSDIANFRHTEADLVSIRLNIFDVDWSLALADLNMQELDANGSAPDPPDYQDVFVRFTAHGTKGPPEAPPLQPGAKIIHQLITDLNVVVLVHEFSELGVFEGPIRPSKGYQYGDDPSVGPIAIADYFYVLPEFIGRNQDRLDGTVNYDVAYNFLFTGSNAEQPSVTQEEVAGFNPRFGPYIFNPCDDQSQGCGYDGAIVDVVDNPILDPANPNPIADAAVSAQTVVAGTEVTLDGSRSFDSSNLGFDTGSSSVFEKDILTYAWEWLSGPERVDPVQDVPTNPKATVVLNKLGTYRYRLIVDDNASPGLPSIAAVDVTVVSDMAGNHPPIATISGPAGPVPLGNEIKLDASASSDPDGDQLTFRWRQVNALGEPIRSDELQGLFQGLSGVDTSVATWQALDVGQFYFRLLVSDGEFVSTATFAISVIDTATAGITVENTDATTSTDAGATPAPADNQPAVAPANTLCGTGMLSLGVVPFALGVMRRRRR